jgi:hypothetical protein
MQYETVRWTPSVRMLLCFTPAGLMCTVFTRCILLCSEAYSYHGRIQLSPATHVPQGPRLWCQSCSLNMMQPAGATLEVALHVTMVLQESWLFVASLSAGGDTTMLVVHVPFASALVVMVYCSGALVLRGLLVDVETLQTCTDDVPSAMAGPQVATAAASTDQEEQAVQCVSKCAFCRCCASQGLTVCCKCQGACVFNNGRPCHGPQVAADSACAVQHRTQQN